MGVEREVLVPDLGEAEDVEVAEVIVTPGERVRVDDPLVVLESDKASVDVPSPVAGTVKELCVEVGENVIEGAVLVRLEVESAAGEEAPEPTPQPDAPAKADPPREPLRQSGRGSLRKPVVEPAVESVSDGPRERAVEAPPSSASRVPEDAPTSVSRPHAGPSVRATARELGVDLDLVEGSGRSGRILGQDVQLFVRDTLSGGAASIAIPDTVVQVDRPPTIDFSAFGPVEVRPLSRTQRRSARNLHRSWVTAPQVTQFDEADISRIEELRRELGPDAEDRGVRLSLLPFVMRGVAAALRDHPMFAASLDPSGTNLIVKHYRHLGIAVDTDRGLVVPVIRDVDRRSVLDLAVELHDVAERARSRRLQPQDLQGGCFTISSLGGIGGTAFTPIVNTPEVAILGLSRHFLKPVYRDGAFVPRRMLPLSLSYDHRVIDGADAARFTTALRQILEEVGDLLLVEGEPKTSS